VTSLAWLSRSLNAWLTLGAWLTPAAWLTLAGLAAACPFCGVVGRSLAERRDAADLVAVGEADGPAARDTDGLLGQPFRLVSPLVGGRGIGPRDADGHAVTARVAAAVDGTAVVFGTRDGADGLRWEAIAADESLLAHVASAPSIEEPAAARLRWYAARLEHPDAAIAADAFTEFGRAPFEAVRAAADALDATRLRAALREPSGDQRRRGFYGLAVGLAAAREHDPETRAVCIGDLHAAVAGVADDRRAGFDGILAGLLVAEGEQGLAHLRDRGLLAADTRPGDARHVLAALRFAWESLGDSLPRERTAAAVAALLDNPAVAADCAVDLARCARWDDIDRVAALWNGHGRDDPLVRRAVAGYLSACPLEAAADHRERIAAADPDAWRAALSAAAVPAR